MTTPRDVVLTRDELLRFECLDRAIDISGMGAADTVTAETVIYRADKFEQYIKEGKPNE